MRDYMGLNIGRVTLRKFKSVVMYLASLALVIGSVSFALPEFFGQVAYAAAPTYVQADQNDPDTALHTHDSTPTLTGSTIGGTTVTVTVNSFTCVSPVVASVWSCDGSFITTPLAANVLYPIQMVATNGDGSITVTDATGVIVDTIAPVISEKVPVASLTTDNTPQYDFYTDSYGVISYTGGGGCSSSQTTANASWQLIDFNYLNDGLYNHCSLYITDSAGNQSNTIDISPFTVDATGPIGGLLTMKTNLFPAGLTVASPTAGIYTLPALSMDGLDQFNSLSVVVTDPHLNTVATPDVYVDGVVNGKMVYNISSNVWDYTGQTSVPNFSSGTHNLVATFSDTVGNTTTLTARFTTDNTAPTITFPISEVNPTLEATGPLTPFTFHPTVTDNVDPAPILTSDTPTGSLFPLGATTVTWTAKDAAGNTSTATPTSIIKDTISPKFDPFNNITVEATSPAGAVVTFAPTATDVTGTPTVTCDPSSGSTFALGTRVVTCTAEDSSHNKSTMTFNVYVQDTTPPAISSVTDITQEATSSSGAIVTFTNPTATDLVDGNVTVICNLPSGSTFPLGKTAVNCSAIDSRGNSSGVAFWVNVVDTTAPIVTSVTIDDNLINEADAGNLVTTTVNYSEAMDQTINPTIGYLNINKADIFTGCSGSWFDADTYKYACTVIDNNVASAPFPNDVGVVVSGAKDLAGNIQGSWGFYHKFDVDTIAPIINIANPNTDSAQSKTITASSDGTLSMFINGTGVTTCDASLSFIPYADKTFSSESDNGKTICYKAIDAVGNVTYRLSNSIAGIDRTAPPVPSVLDMQATSDSGYSNSDNITNLNPIFNVTGVADSDYYRVYWWVDHSFWGILSDSNPGTQKTWNVSQFGAPWTYRLALTAYDSLGNESAVSPYLDFTIDTTAPTTAEITTPQNSETISGTYNITANAIDDYSGIDRVEFYHESLPTLICTDNDSSNGFGCDWNTTLVADGPHQLYIIAYDKAGNHVQSSNVNVIVDNTAPVITADFYRQGLGDHYAKVGDIVQVSFVASEPVTPPDSMIIAGHAIPSYQPQGGNNFYIYYTMTAGDTEGQLTYSLTAHDAAGNSTTVTGGGVLFDKTAPIIDATTPKTIEVGTTSYDFMDGVTASDGAGSGISGNISIISNNVDLNVLGQYNVTFQVYDKAGNVGEKTIVVNIVDTQNPVITLLGTTPVTVEKGTIYADAGATASDNYDGDITADIEMNSDVDTDTVGSYIVTYDVMDSSGNEANQISRVVNVVDTTAPVITLFGSPLLSLIKGQTFVDDGAKTDDGSIIIVTGSVNTAVVGTYILTYNSTDAAGNIAKPVTRTVIVNAAPAVVLGVTTTGSIQSDSNSGLLADNDSGQPAESDQGTPATLGSETTNNNSNNSLTNPAAVAATSSGWKIFGLMWYWWLLILAAIASAWWIISAAIHRNHQGA